MQLDRRTVIGGLGNAAFMFALPGVALAGPSGTERPNIVFIMADDLGYADLSCTGSHHIRTPAIDSIAADGLQLTQGYSSTPICSPTRTALLTGCYAQRFLVGLEEPLGNNVPTNIGVPYDVPTIASILRSAGYQTKLIGKWHLGRPPEHGPLQHGYDEFLGIVEGAADYFRHHLVSNGEEVGIGLARDNVAIDESGYLTDLLGDEAVRTIESPSARPFFISLHFTAPHWPWEGREDAAVAQALQRSSHNEGGSLKKYREMVEVMDQNVAKVLAALQRTGQAGNTIVIFTSDNGGERFSETWPFVGQKGEVLEGGVRVPILIRWPAFIAAGSRSEQVMASMDFLPTLLTMTGGHPTQAGVFDGFDLSSQLLGSVQPVERTLFWRFKAHNQAAVRKGEWKYVKIAGEEHLFNLAEDVRERADRAQAEPSRVAAMRALWDSWNSDMLPYGMDGNSQDLRREYVDRY